MVALALFAIIPPSRKIRLGLDLKGGVQSILVVHTDDALKLETDTTAEQLQESVKNANIPGVTVKPQSITTFTATGVPSGSDQQFRQIAETMAAGDYDRAPATDGGYLFTMKPNVAVNNRAQAVTQAIQTIERRVNELGVSEPVVAPYGTAADEIIVQLPGMTDPARAREIIKSTARLELDLVEGGPMSDQAALLQPYGGKVPDGMKLVPSATGGTPADPASRPLYLVHSVPAVTGSDLRDARMGRGDLNRPEVMFTLNSEGSAKFADVTGANIGRFLAIVLDNARAVGARALTGGSTHADARITGSFTEQEATDLALMLRSGALPASLDYLEQREVGPTLGADSIRAGIIASVIGLGLVTLFMLVYYRLSGINAFVSIALNLIILLGFMAYLGAVMTLPGIAGFILTIGMGVDSNVLIFERIREELATKKGVRQAIAAGFDRVFITIVDTHVSSLIAAAFLFQFGTGPIRGFATTLFFGLLSNVFTAVFVSRTLFEFILSRKPAGATQLSI